MSASTALLEALPVAVYTTDAQGHITFFNETAAEMWGHRPAIGADQWCGSWRLFWPDGRPLRHDECPMAIMLKEGRPIRGIEAIAERPDGTRVRFLPYPTPIRDSSGRLVGGINLLVDITDRYQAELESKQLAAIVESSDDAIVSKTLDGTITSWNAGAACIFGYQADEMIGQPITRIIPPELHDEEEQILARLRRGERIHHYETVRVAKDGRRVDFSVTVSPLFDRWGRVIGASKVGRDITERKQAENLQRLLLEELNHRVKNTLATVQAIAKQSLRRSRSSADFVSGFSGRIQALARAHDLITRTRMQSAELIELIREQVMLGIANNDRITCSGPRIVLDAQTAVHVGLVLHELATNARKYGALSSATGQLAVNWELRSNGGRVVILDWQESGGPKVSAPTERGFGTALIQQIIQGHGGEAVTRFGSQGIHVKIKLPLPQQAQPDIDATAQVARNVMKPTLVEPSEPHLRLAGKRVLVIEDEPLVSMDIESSLTDAGCEVVGPAAMLETAKFLAANADCDLALLDVNLGGQPVDEIASSLTRKNVPFAFVTGHGRDGLPVGFREAVVLRKPFSNEQLLAVLESLLHQSAGVVALRQKRD